MTSQEPLDERPSNPQEDPLYREILDGPESYPAALEVIEVVSRLALMDTDIAAALGHHRAVDILKEQGKLRPEDNTYKIIAKGDSEYCIYIYGETSTVVAKKPKKTQQTYPYIVDAHRYNEDRTGRVLMQVNSMKGRQVGHLLYVNPDISSKLDGRATKGSVKAFSGINGLLMDLGAPQPINFMKYKKG